MAGLRRGVAMISVRQLRDKAAQRGRVTSLIVGKSQSALVDKRTFSVDNN